MRLLRLMTAFGTSFLVTGLVVVAANHALAPWLKMIWNMPELVRRTLP